MGAPSSTTHSRAGTLFGGVFLSIFALAWCGLLAFIDAELGSKFWHQARSSCFAQGQATVLKSEVSKKRGSKGRSNYGLEIAYSYKVNGRQYTSERYAFQAIRASDGGWFNKVARQNRGGSTVPVYYDPAHPHRAVLRRGLDGSDLFLLIFLTPFHLIGVALLTGVLSPLFRGRNPIPTKTEPGGRERIYVGDFRPWAAFLAMFGFASFISVFALAIPYGFHPPLAAPVTAWIASFLAALWLGLSTHRRIKAGEFDLILDRHGRQLSVPPMYDRPHREELPFNAIAEVTSREVLAQNKHSRRRPRYVPEVVLHTSAGTTYVLKKPLTLSEAHRWAAALRERIGI